jgi:hypothetical protein
MRAILTALEANVHTKSQEYHMCMLDMIVSMAEHEGAMQPEEAGEAAKSVATIMLVHGTSNSMQIPKLLEMASKTMAHLCEPENNADVLSQSQ